MSETLSRTKRMQPSKVKENLRTKILGQAILYFRELTSTNDIAKELTAKGVNEGTIVVAEIQTKGKGRFKREWESPRGGLWFSVILKPNVQPRHAPRLTLLASVAVVKTLDRLYGLKTEIKWPNDVLIDRKKVCGVLSEGQIKGKTLSFAILGLGINANFSIEALSLRLRETATTLQRELGREIEREILLCELLKEIESCYELLNRGTFEAVLNDWRRLAGFLGSYVKTQRDKQEIEGWAVDVDGDGALIIRQKNGASFRVTSGDVIKIFPKICREHVQQ